MALGPGGTRTSLGVARQSLIRAVWLIDCSPVLFPCLLFYDFGADSNRSIVVQAARASTQPLASERPNFRTGPRPTPCVTLSSATSCTMDSIRARWRTFQAPALR